MEPKTTAKEEKLDKEMKILLQRIKDENAALSKILSRVQTNQKLSDEKHVGENGLKQKKEIL